MLELKAISAMMVAWTVLNVPVASANTAEPQIVYARVRNMNGAVNLLPVFDPRGNRMRFEVMVDENDTPVQLRNVKSRGGEQRYMNIEPDPNGHVFFRLRAVESNGRKIFDPAERPSVMRTIPMEKSHSGR